MWRHYNDLTASGWDCLGDFDALVVVPLVLVAAFVVIDTLVLRGERPTAVKVAEVLVTVALVAAAVALFVAANDESPAVFDGGQADDSPQGPAYAAFGGIVVVLSGWAGLAWAVRRIY